MKGKTESTEIQIVPLDRGVVTVAIVGTTPFICERMSQKASFDLLFPTGKKTQSEKIVTMKHVPLREYRDSCYQSQDPKSPTLIQMLAVSFKKAMMTAALDDPGTKKAQVGRLVRVEGERIPLYGVPQMVMNIVRSADISRTPDVRTRTILPQWAALIEIGYAKPQLREKAVLDLLAKAGVFSGVGGWRTEKGSGNYGSFRLAGASDPEFKSIVKAGGRTAQMEALNSPAFYDDETEYLFAEWKRRATDKGFEVVA